MRMVNDAVGPAVAAACRRVARDAGRPFVSAVITCGAAAAAEEEEEEEEEDEEEGRAESGRMGLRDVEVLWEFRGTWEVWI